MTNNFDMAVIGSGPGGYVCAIRAAQLGLSVICIDKRGSHGGTCLNVGCIPSKALLHASELFIEKNKFAAMGIEAENISLNLSAMMSYKDEGVQGNVKGIDYLFKKNKIEGVFGQAKIMGSNKVKITLPDGETRDIEADNIVVATDAAFFNAVLVTNKGSIIPDLIILHFLPVITSTPHWSLSMYFTGKFALSKIVSYGETIESNKICSDTSLAITF